MADQKFYVSHDPFNWPTPQRKDLMLLSNINRNDTGKYFQKDFIESTKNYNQTNKERTVQSCHDSNYLSKFEDTKPKRFFRDTNQLRTDDLQQKKMTGFNREHRFNPLEPEYKIPSYVPIEPMQYSKPAKNILQVDDIQGACSSKDPWYNRQRNVNPYTEIEGSKPKVWKEISGKVGSLDVRDINNKKNAQGRQNNPLEPVYDWTIDGKLEKYSFNPKPFMKINPNAKGRVSQFQVNDIEGNETWLGPKIFNGKNRRDFKKTNEIVDIIGAQPGSLKKGIQTKRQTNPVDPKY